MRAGYGKEPLSCEEYYQQAVEYGHEIVGENVLRALFGNKISENAGYYYSIIGWKQPERDHLGLPAGNEPFPYNFNLYSHSFVQLIVGRKSSLDATDLLRSFDLDICRTSYNGHHFSVPSPSETFLSQTACETSRHALMEQFLLTEKTKPRETWPQQLTEVPNTVWSDVGLDQPNDENWWTNFEFIQKLILRMQKYTTRGVTVLNPP